MTLKQRLARLEKVAGKRAAHGDEARRAQQRAILQRLLAQLPPEQKQAMFRLALYVGENDRALSSHEMALACAAGLAMAREITPGERALLGWPA
jgi:hypothetical protein